MAAKLDSRVPVMVIAGHWNHAILNEPPWVAQHVLRLRSGEELEVRSIVQGDDSGNQKQIWQYEQFGISTNGHRAEFYLGFSGEEANLYKAVADIMALLPHTPVSAVGVNFHIVADEDVTAMVGSLETEESLDSFGETFSSERTDKITLPTERLLVKPDKSKFPTILKVSRSTNFESFSVDLNFHQEIDDMNSLSSWLELEPIAHWKSFSEEFLLGCYGIENLEQLSF
jgi:hypothetical protein